eukprot:14389942-Ditylum_brightwellii.AAC.1
MRTLEKGLKFHHIPNKSVRMKKHTGDKVTMDKDNSEVFATHFHKVFNNPDPPRYYKSTLPLVPI